MNNKQVSQKKITTNIKKVRFNMDLSPNDIRNYEFPNQMRGYDKEEVDSFLDQIATVLENMKQETLRLSMENDSVKSQLESLKQFEDTIKGAAIDARQNADTTIANAKEKSEKMLSEAKQEAENLVGSQESKLKDYNQQLERLEHTKSSFVDEIKDIINLHLKMVNKISDQQFSYTPDPTGTIEVTDSEEVSRKEMTTIASEPHKEQIVTEEANAADKIVPAPEAAKEAPPLDPELAEALAGYQHPEPTAEGVSSETMIGADTIPKQGEVVETTKRAEDIPDGFIVPESDADTGKMNLAPKAQENVTEHNDMNIDIPVVTEKKPDATPDNIVDELDNVVAKFEEEMDKAEKS